jgi:hypothetical protein
MGRLPIAKLERHHIRTIMDNCAGRPGTARVVLSMLKVLIAFAIDGGIEMADPTTGIKRPKLSAEGWHTWTEDEIASIRGEAPDGITSASCVVARGLDRATCRRLDPHGMPARP